MDRLTAVVFVACSATVASAGPTAWHAGTNLRTELSTHALRVEGGLQFGRLDLTAVLDPMVFTDDEMDIDALATWDLCRSGYALLAGWRPASIGLASGRQFQETLLLGATGRLPNIGALELRFGLEIAAVLVKHGGGVPTDVTSFSSSSEVGDNINLSMFLTVRYGRAL